MGGEFSPFEELHGFSIDGVDPETSALPEGWRDRLVKVRNADTAAPSGEPLDRAEARAFADVHALAALYGTDRLLELAVAVDAGSDVGVFVDMLDSLSRFTDDEIPAADGDALAVRAFTANWAAALRERGVRAPEDSMVPSARVPSGAGLSCGRRMPRSASCARRVTICIEAPGRKC